MTRKIGKVSNKELNQLLKKKPIYKNIASIIPSVPFEPIVPGSICSVAKLPLGAVIRRNGGLLATIVFRNQSRVRIAQFHQQTIRPKDDEDQVITTRKEFDISPDAEVYLEALTQADVREAPPVERPEKPKKRDLLAEAIQRRTETPKPKVEKVSIPKNDPEELKPTTTLEELWGIASGYLDESMTDLKAKYAHLDRGRQSMTLRNRIRSAFKKKVA